MNATRRSSGMWTALGPGGLHRHRDYGNLVVLRRTHVIGSLALPDGALIIGDPFLLDDQQPTTVPSGVFEVRVITAESDSGRDNEGLAIVLDRTEPVSWEPVLGVSASGLPLGVPVDSASIAFANRADQRCVVGVGSDGVYVPWVGRDERGTATCVAVLAGDAERWVAWDLTADGLPAVDVEHDASIYRWCEQVTGGDGLVAPGVVDDATLRELEALAGFALPPALRDYYQRYSPWVGDGVDLRTWRTCHAWLVEHEQLTAYPLIVDSDESFAVVRPLAPGQTAVFGYYEGSTLDAGIDPAAYVLMRTIAVWDLHLPPDLR